MIYQIKHGNTDESIIFRVTPNNMVQIQYYLYGIKYPCEDYLRISNEKGFPVNLHRTKLFNLDEARHFWKDIFRDKRWKYVGKIDEGVIPESNFV